MLSQYTTDQLYDLHQQLCSAARSLHLAWRIHLAATGSPTSAAGDMSGTVASLAADVYAELKARYTKDTPEWPSI